ncbi:MAG: ABC transporter substrate binding protein, partial [Betaproteobacteria bacterium]
MAITGGLLLAVAAGAIAQSTPKRAARIVLFSTGRPETHSYLTEAFRMAMRELGYVEGRDVVYSYRWADGRMDRVSQLASEIARDNPDIVITGTALSTRAVVEAAPGAAVVMAYGSDPVGNQLVASLARPGGRVTGLSNLGEGIVPKMLELLRAMVPKAGR